MNKPYHSLYSPPEVLLAGPKRGRHLSLAPPFPPCLPFPQSFRPVNKPYHSLNSPSEILLAGPQRGRHPVTVCHHLCRHLRKHSQEAKRLTIMA